MPFALIVVEGIPVGVLTGLVGVGGGFLIVPALVILGRVPMREAVGTSLAAIAGVGAGTYLVRLVPQETLKRGFAVFLLVVGTFVLYQNGRVIAGMFDTVADHVSGAPISATGVAQ